MDEKRVLVLSFYYQPDLSAGSFRTTALVEALLQRQSPKIVVEVITTMPNRYSSFSPKVPEQESVGQLHVRRIKLPLHRSGMVDQALAFAHFAREATQLVRHQKYDLIFATSGRLMTAALGAWISNRLRTPLYLDIRDIFVDTIKDVLPKKFAIPLKLLSSIIERWTINRAVHVNLVSQGFQPYFHARYPRQSFSYFTNGIDQEFLHEHAKIVSGERATSRPLLVLYAGNMGEGQGLHVIIPAVAQRLGNRANFRLIGDGGRRAQLEKALGETGVGNVELALPLPRDVLIKEYLKADVLFLHLNNYDAFKKVLPSKIFEYAALGKPIWAGVSGYVEKFLREEVSNVAVFPPCDAVQALKAFNQLEIRDAPRAEFVQKYSRKRIMCAMAADIISQLKLAEMRLNGCH